jgi:hypothetical protein
MAIHMMNIESIQLRSLAMLGLLLPAVLSAQTAAPRVDVGVRVASVNVRGDTLDISYVVENRPASPIDLWTFGLVTHVPVIRLSATADRHNWSTLQAHGDERMAIWVADGDILRAGETSLPLVMTAVGITDIVEFIAVPDLTQIKDTVEDDEPHDQMREAGTHGTTVGIVPPPLNQTPATQAARLTGFLDQSCGAANWITNAGVCNSLRRKLEQATTAIAAGDMAKATQELNAFVHELDAQYGPEPGKHVSATAYALLRPNAVVLLRP